MNASVPFFLGGIFTLIGVGLMVATMAPADSPGRRWLAIRRAALDDQLRALFLPPNGGTILAVQAVGLVAAVVLSLTMDVRWILLVPPAVAGPDVILAIQRRERQKKIDDQLPGWLSTLGQLLQVTGSMSDAVRQSADMVKPPMRQDLDLVVKELKLAVPLRDALRGLAARGGGEHLADVVTIIDVGSSSGGALPSLLEETAASVRERQRLEGVLRKQTASGRFQLLILLLAPGAIIAGFRQVEATFFDPLTHSGLLGYAIAGFAAVLWFVALIMARKILAVEI